jgi:single-strand DNA-binding protein
MEPGNSRFFFILEWRSRAGSWCANNATIFAQQINLDHGTMYYKAKEKKQMAGFQQVMIVGNIGKDAELRYTQNGIPVCNFNVAVNTVYGTGETRQEKTTWFRVTLWRKMAETLSQYLVKGKQVMVVGTIAASAYDAADGPRATLEITAESLQLLGSRGASLAPHEDEFEDELASDEIEF